MSHRAADIVEGYAGFARGRVRLLSGKANE
jgi:hypothetical protein